MKTCLKCNKTKPLRLFSKHKGFKDGHRSRCKQCSRVDSYDYYQKNKEKLKDRPYDNESSYRSKKKYPEKHCARVKAGQAKLEQKPCEDCGESNTVKHHEDYKKPLEVTWLCCSCHAKRHRKDD